METFGCGHAALRGKSLLCPHLLDPSLSDYPHKAVLRGAGLQRDLCCPACADLATGEREWVESCEGCVDRVADDVWEFLGFIGEPGIDERPTDLGVVIRRHDFALDHAQILAIEPIESCPGVWLALDGSGQVIRFDTTADEAEIVGTIGTDLWHRLEAATHPAESTTGGAPTMFRASPSGRYVAVLMARGQYGWSIDLDNGTTLQLDRGTSHVWAYDFAAAYVVVNDRELLVHATACNRLDLTDPSSGELLTARVPPNYVMGEGIPAHYLDYFHSRLYPSPSHRWLVDDGWVWHPVGVITAWNLQAWLDNVWESEDGPTRRSLLQRSYYWGHPMCWIDDATLAVFGIGFDDDFIIAGVRIIDVETRVERLEFAGPDGDLFALDGRLVSSGPSGVHVWDPDTGERLGTVDGFLPAAVHRSGGELITFDHHGVRTARLSGPRISKSTPS